MESITIRLDNRTRYMKILSVVLVCLGTLVIGLHASDFISNELSEHWLSSVFIALCAITAGIFIIKGYSLVQRPELIIDLEGIKTQKTSIWDKSVKWNELKAISLHKSNIHIQYCQTGAHDKIHLPVYTQSQYNQIKQKLKEAATKFDLEFVQE